MITGSRGGKKTLLRQQKAMFHIEKGKIFGRGITYNNINQRNT